MLVIIRRIKWFFSSRNFSRILKDVEGDEQEQVGGDDDVTVEGSFLGTVTVAQVGEDAVEVDVCVVGVGAGVDEADVDQELDDLETGDPLFPPDLDAAGGEEVVEVHEDVDGQVQGDDDPLDGRVADDLRVAQQRGCPVVVGVEEEQLLSSEDQERRVEQLEELSQVVEVVETDQLLGERLAGADGVEEPVVVPDREHLLDHQEHEDERDCGEEEVVHLEETVELDWTDVELGHDVLAAQDDDVVGDDDGDGVREVGQEGLVRDELELVCAVACDELEGLVEDGP
ncbi:hypothetical protein PMKS-003704 [Pichia membranifaciens]|uniref:Uncharacterized protein n=1 Tax=Pichia membranifaciens TaxID=4926 RepID=A0A1Q2YKX2_9ASCO|nr:hypothetical protein PMKS-003704 [Pichia membranifaciens]